MGFFLLLLSSLRRFPERKLLLKSPIYLFVVGRKRHGKDLWRRRHLRQVCSRYPQTTAGFQFATERRRRQRTSVIKCKCAVTHVQMVRSDVRGARTRLLFVGRHGCFARDVWSFLLNGGREAWYHMDGTNHSFLFDLTFANNRNIVCASGQITHHHYIIMVEPSDRQ